MSFKFLKQSLDPGYYEPEGIYLTLPFERHCLVVQAWGEESDFYGAYTYNGVPLKGHNGIDILAEPGAAVLAVDAGRVMGIGIEAAGWGRYLKIEHKWGESLYAHLGTVTVDAGQQIAQMQRIATVASPLHHSMSGKVPSYLHLSIRIKPYNRFDGWGGFSDPIPFLEHERLSFSSQADSTGEIWSAPTHNRVAPDRFAPHPMLVESTEKRRP